MGLSYRDAVRLIGGQQSTTVVVLDRLAGGLLLASSATGFGFALSLFEAKGELARLSDDLVRGLGNHLYGLDRFSRSERLAAAHSVVALTAFFEALSRIDLPLMAKDLALTKSEQVALMQGQSPGRERFRDLADGLLRADVPVPAPQRPYEMAVADMREFFQQLAGRLLQFVAGMAVYERLGETAQQRYRDKLSRALPAEALARYEDLFRQLAVDFPEVAFWANLVDHQATREMVRWLGGGLEGLEQLLAGVASGRLPDDRRSALARAYRAVLQRPILASDRVPAGLRLPDVGEAYVNPDFRVADEVVLERLADEARWNEQEVRHDLEGFLAGHLTAPQAAAAPLLLLGQPGSGKSMFTQVVAARLPPEEFLVVRVALRDVAADSDLQTQIEHAIRSATGESLAWPDLARSAGDAMPVVLLDGFDELLQATGVSQTDYLKKVAAFQTREADQGRPAAVVVTSRTAVADRALPVPGMVALRLEPFRVAHITRWLSIWNQVNATAFATQGLQPLATQTVLTYPELASQPLLLLMLAFYDADGNQLQRGGAALEQTVLYERLLMRFAEREISKASEAGPPEESARLVDRELLLLSVVAFAMFNRGRQWVTEDELKTDLAALLEEPDERAGSVGLRARLSTAQLVIGRFFFIYQAQATRDETQLRTYEFLHTTFGEYLIARLVVRELADLADDARSTASRIRSAPARDAFLHALLSYMPLTTRGTVVTFLAEQLKTLPHPQRNHTGAVLASLFREALGPRHDIRHGDYAPQAGLPVPARYAAYTANLILLIVLTIGEVTGTALFPLADPASEWRKMTLLWRSQLPAEGWMGMIEAISLNRIWNGDQRDIALRPDQAGRQPDWLGDPLWGMGIGPEDEHRASPPHGYSIWTRRSSVSQVRFTCDADDDALTHALAPLARELGTTITTFHSYGEDPDHAVSAANALIALWLASSKDSEPGELAAAYDSCLNITLHGFAPFDTDTYEKFRLLVLRQLARDQDRLPAAWLTQAIRKIQETRNDDIRQGRELFKMAQELLPDLFAADSASNKQE